MKRGSEKGEKRRRNRERKTIAFNQKQRCTHTSPRTEHPVNIKEIFLRSTAAWPKINYHSLRQTLVL